MATQLYFSRDTKVYIEFNNYVWEVPVLDGFSFSQGNNTSEITLAEMESAGGVSRRGRRAFNDSLAPGEWSLSTYVRPFKATAGSADGTADDIANVHAVEEVLWAMMAGANAYDTVKKDYENTLSIPVTDMVQGETYEIVSVGNTDFTATNVATFEAGVSAANTAGLVITAGSVAASGTGTVKRKVTAHTTTQNRVSFHASNTSELFGTANIYFVLGDANRTVMKLKGAVVNEASIDFEIDGISTIAWSGQCSEVLDFSGSTHIDSTLPVHSDATLDGDGTIAVGDVWLDADDGHRLYVMTNVSNGNEAATPYAINEAITDTSNFIRNRLTTLTVDGTNTSGLLSAYDVTLTGGNVTISNNLTFITPEEIGLVNVPIGHVTGTRSVTGSFTCYLSVDSATRDGSGNKSRDLFEDLRALTSTVTNNVNLTFSIGGGSGNRLEINCPTSHLEIPTHSIEDVISLETNFQALPSTIDNTNEVTLTYKV